MTDGEKMIWSAAYVAAFNEYCPTHGISGAVWEHLRDEVQSSVTQAIERATLTVNALRAVTTEVIETQVCDDAGGMVSEILECDA